MSYPTLITFMSLMGELRPKQRKQRKERSRSRQGGAAARWAQLLPSYSPYFPRGLKWNMHTFSYSLLLDEAMVSPGSSHWQTSCAGSGQPRNCLAGLGRPFLGCAMAPQLADCNQKPVGQKPTHPPRKVPLPGVGEIQPVQGGREAHGTQGTSANGLGGRGLRLSPGLETEDRGPGPGGGQQPPRLKPGTQHTHSAHLQHGKHSLSGFHSVRKHQAFEW